MWNGTPLQPPGFARLGGVPGVAPSDTPAQRHLAPGQGDQAPSRARCTGLDLDPVPGLTGTLFVCPFHPRKVGPLTINDLPICLFVCLFAEHPPPRQKVKV